MTIMDMLMIPGLDNSKRLRQVRQESKDKATKALNTQRMSLSLMYRNKSKDQKSS